jgi:hypothetical protein
LGIPVRPPQFISFWGTVVEAGGLFGALNFLVYVWMSPSIRLPHVVLIHAIMGAVFGLVMAAVVRQTLPTPRLPTWASYCRTDMREVADLFT